jgi:D-aspartate ligase
MSMTTKRIQARNRGRPARDRGRNGDVTVAVFDAELPPGVAFARAAHAAGARVLAFSPFRFAAGRYSRSVHSFHHRDSGPDEDAFAEWLADTLDREAIDHVAPTSDSVVYALAEVQERTGRRLLLPSIDAVRDCLFKVRFSEAMARTGLLTPPTATPTNVGEALAAAEEIGYPVVLKPRSHVKIGHHRGVRVDDPEQLRNHFVPFDVSPSRHDPHLALPLVQRYLPSENSAVISVTGFLDADGTATAVDHCLKLGQWPPRFGVGCLFEALPTQSFTARSLDAAAAVLGRGPFELEVLLDTRTGETWALDLNARGFGQMALSIDRGNDLPALWYADATGTAAPQVATRSTTYWRQGVHHRLSRLHSRLTGRPRTARPRGRSVGAVFRHDDPMPGIAFGLFELRHPRALVRPFWRRGL